MRERVIDFFQDLYHSIRAYFYTIRRSFFWGWKLRNNYDYDAFQLYEIIYLKLNRVYRFVRKHGHTVWSQSDCNSMKKLIEAIGLAKRLSEAKYEYFHKNVHSFMKKYKNQRQRKGLVLVSDTFKNAKPIDEKLFRFMFRKASEKDKKRWDTDKKRLFYLLDKYIDVWWD